MEAHPSYRGSISAAGTAEGFTHHATGQVSQVVAKDAEDSVYGIWPFQCSPQWALFRDHSGHSRHLRLVHGSIALPPSPATAFPRHGLCHHTVTPLCENEMAPPSSYFLDHQVGLHETGLQLRAGARITASRPVYIGDGFRTLVSFSPDTSGSPLCLAFTSSSLWDLVESSDEAPMHAGKGRKRDSEESKEGPNKRQQMDFKWLSERSAMETTHIGWGAGLEVQDDADGAGSVGEDCAVVKASLQIQVLTRSNAVQGAVYIKQWRRIPVENGSQQFTTQASTKCAGRFSLPRTSDATSTSCCRLLLEYSPRQGAIVVCADDTTWCELPLDLHQSLGLRWPRDAVWTSLTSLAPQEESTSNSITVSSWWHEGAPLPQETEQAAEALNVAAHAAQRAKQEEVKAATKESEAKTPADAAGAGSGAGPAQDMDPETASLLASLGYIVDPANANQPNNNSTAQPASHASGGGGSGGPADMDPATREYLISIGALTPEGGLKGGSAEHQPSAPATVAGTAVESKEETLSNDTAPLADQMTTAALAEVGKELAAARGSSDSHRLEGVWDTTLGFMACMPSAEEGLAFRVDSEFEGWAKASMGATSSSRGPWLTDKQLEHRGTNPAPRCSWLVTWEPRAQGNGADAAAWPLALDTAIAGATAPKDGKPAAAAGDSVWRVRGWYQTLNAPMPNPVDGTLSRLGTVLTATWHYGRHYGPWEVRRYYLSCRLCYKSLTRHCTLPLRLLCVCFLFCFCFVLGYC